MIVVGGGVIGCELAMLYAAFGVKITIVELMPTILPMVDAEIVKALLRVMRKFKIDVMTGTKLVAGEASETGFRGTLDNGKIVEAQKCLVVVGRKPLVNDCGAAELGLVPDGRKIAVDNRCATSVPGIWAIGDATGQWMLAHSAYKMAEIAAENIMGHHKTTDGVVIPNGIFTIPEIGIAGVTEEQAREKYGEVKIGTYLYRPLGRAQASGALDGIFKVIARASDNVIVGVAIFGEGGTDLVAEGALAVQKGMKLEDIVHTVHSHPTYSEGFHEACASAIGCGVHSLAAK
ncbi:MAG: hypothetical protein Kow00107_10610 [Planctomycetota bacterium]